METNSPTWQERFGLTTCSAADIDRSMATATQGVAVIYSRTEADEKILLVLESRTSGLRHQCAKRLQNGKLPPIEQLMISFRGGLLPDGPPEAIHAACREQVIFAGELRRALRPAMR